MSQQEAIAREFRRLRFVHELFDMSDPLCDVFADAALEALAHVRDPQAAYWLREHDKLWERTARAETLLREIRKWMDAEIGAWDAKFIAEIDAALTTPSLDAPGEQK